MPISKRRYKISCGQPLKVREQEIKFGGPGGHSLPQGSLIVVEIPFSDLSGVKRRPAIILSQPAFHQRLPDVLACPVSSQPHYFEHPGPGDIPLTSWRSLGLHHPSTARTSKLLAVDKKIVKRTLSQLSSADLLKVQTILKDALGLA